MLSDPVDVVLVGVAADAERALDRDGGFRVRSVDELSAIEGSADAVVLPLDGSAPLEVIRAIRAGTPDAAVVVVTEPGHEADGTIALHAGAEEQLVGDATLPSLLPRAIRYAVEIRRLRRELSTTDAVTGLPNLRGFVPIAEHHLRMADRTQQPVIFVFVRFDDADIAPDAEELAIDVSGVVLDAVRASDVPARISPDTFCVLLAGASDGGESLVLSRLVEAIAVHDARRDRPRALALSVGTARYEPGSGTPLSHIIEAAERWMTRRDTAAT
ncbi:MAG TPA: diguanylate cyclase [Actinomycetota bacterium]|nr:diguanylate cyclase [Actinomycetota bacterium]